MEQLIIQFYGQSPENSDWMVGFLPQKYWSKEVQEVRLFYLEILKTIHQHVSNLENPRFTERTPQFWEGPIAYRVFLTISINFHKPMSVQYIFSIAGVFAVAHVGTPHHTRSYPERKPCPFSVVLFVFICLRKGNGQNNDIESGTSPTECGFWRCCGLRIGDWVIFHPLRVDIKDRRGAKPKLRYCPCKGA